MSRKMVDCREHPSEVQCSLVLAGEEEEVIRAAAEHSVSVHGETDSAALREQIRQSMRDEPADWGESKQKGPAWEKDRPRYQ